ncbi:tRNA1(Val) (adenine(37)-N6)-methyltransferase [Neptunomonas japonica]|uniref:tRNA1(Val) (adenine(37)-N6)-methyltransferase n=1 Tax=Neptunomonas japonica TaxID=417574 RepID=UPI00041ABC38|nr:methyltransferase [Neptunomonas japonica]
MTRRKRNSYFECKQFKIEQGDCAMKVTTDASLLGAYANVKNTQRILDIGTGTGLLSLFAAQRTSAFIDAVELDAQAATQARINFHNSPWPERLSLIEMDIRDYADQQPQRYDCILTNPPFFTDSTHNACDRASLARHNSQLPLIDLIKAIDKLLTANGQVWILLPLQESETLVKLAEPLQLYPQERMLVRNSDQHEAHREIMTLGREPTDIKQSTFTLYKEHPFHTHAAAALFDPYYTRMKVED